MYEHLKMVKGIGPFDLLAKQPQRERNFQDATLSESLLPSLEGKLQLQLLMSIRRYLK